MYFLASSSNGSASIYLVCICGMLVLQAYAHTCFACQGACLSVSACHNTPISRYCIRTAYVVASSYSFATHFTALQQGTTLAALLSLHYPHTGIHTHTCRHSIVGGSAYKHALATSLKCLLCERLCMCVCNIL